MGASDTPRPKAAMPTPSYLHTAWAFGHFVVLACAAYALVQLPLFRFARRAYYGAYAGALLSWGIVVYKSLGTPQPSRAYVQKALLDENVQYLLLAIYWYLQKPIYFTLIPFATFSLFHALTYVRTSVLPKVPSSSSQNGAKANAQGAQKKDAPATPQTLNGMQKLSKSIQGWVKQNYQKAMLFVSFIEVCVLFPRLLLGAVSFQNSVFAPLFFVHFLRLRYYLSPTTRDAFAWVDKQLQAKVIQNQSVPAGVKRGVSTVREMIIRYSETAIGVGQPPNNDRAR